MWAYDLSVEYLGVRTDGRGEHMRCTLSIWMSELTEGGEHMSYMLSIWMLELTEEGVGT